MLLWALAGKEKALGPDHTSTLDTVNNLGLLYADQGKLGEAERMCQRALAGNEKALGPDHTSTLDTVNSPSYSSLPSYSSSSTSCLGSHPMNREDEETQIAEVNIRHPRAAEREG